MKRGHRTSEFYLALLWSLKAALAVAALLSFSPSNWPAALCALPAVCLLVWFAGFMSANYAENRFQLKAQREALRHKQPQEEDGPAEPARTIGFGRHVASPADGEDDEEEGEE